MVKKRLSSDERRLRILEAATKTFAEMGYAEASMDRIARASEITKPVLYDHFESKEALLVVVLEAIRDKLLSEGRKASALPGTRERQVRAAVEAFLTLAQESPHAVRVLVSVAHGDPVAAKLARAVQSAAVQQIAAMLERGAPEAPEWMLSAAAQFVLGGLHATALRWLDDPSVKVDALVDLIAALCWGGLSAFERVPAAPV
jgi:AcrR family transcriptional regulator